MRVRSLSEFNMLVADDNTFSHELSPRSMYVVAPPGFSPCFNLFQSIAFPNQRNDSEMLTGFE